MKVYEVTTHSGSEYVITERAEGDGARYFFTANKAAGKGARFVGHEFEVTRPMPWPIELDIPIWVTGGPSEKAREAFPSSSGHLKTSPVASYLQREVADA